MRDALVTRAGLLLYRQLPEEYRYRDNPREDEPGDLEAYLHGFGHLFDLIRGTLEQLYADGFAEPADNGREIQTWLLPYLAELVGAKLIAPDPQARRRELNNTIGWYKGKGSLRTIDDISDVVAGAEVVVVEDWQRTLITPRVALPPFTLPRTDLDDPRGPAGRPLGTPDLRVASRAVRDPGSGDPLRKFTLPKRDGNGFRESDPPAVFWQPWNRTGVPCFPGSYEDRMVRTPDLRDPALGDVGPHPKRLHVFVQPPLGFFEENLREVTSVQLTNAVTAAGAGSRNETFGPREALQLPEGDPVPDKIVVTGEFTVPQGTTLELADLLFKDQVVVEQGATLRMERCAARVVDLAAPPAGAPMLVARDCLFDDFAGTTSFAQLEYVTVLGITDLGRLWASDCLFAGPMSPLVCQNEKTCIRFSCLADLPEGVGPATCGSEHSRGNTADQPMFLVRYITEPDGTCAARMPDFGEPGCGVLHHLTPASIAGGAEDEGEMGAYHHLHHAASLGALTRKLADFTPLGTETAVVYDIRMSIQPPAVGSSGGS